MLISPHRRRLFVIAATVLTLSATLVSEAEARRGGSFGSRGSRTYQSIRPGRATGFAAAPIQRSMTPRTPNPGQQPGGAFGQTPSAGRGGFMQRWGGPLLGGLALGGLIGMFMGHGMGGGGMGLLSLLLQLGIAALVVMLVMRFVRSRRPAAAGGAAFQGTPGALSGFGGSHGFGRNDFTPQDARPAPASLWGVPQAPAPKFGGSACVDTLVLGADEVAGLERLFIEVQTAFGDEDYGALRERSTPEVMGFLSEELAQNATAGRRNAVRDVRVIQRDLAEAWTDEDGRAFASLALRFCSIDVVLDRASGALVEGDAERATEAHEIWTFVRDPGGFGAAAWKVSAIQEAA